MSERFASDLVFILVVLVVAAILGFLIGYFLRKYFSEKEHTIHESPSEILRLNGELIKAQNEIKDLSAKLQLANIELQAKPLIAENSHKVQMKFDAEFAKSVFGKNIKENDLKLIEGIGPKIESILNNNGVNTWQQLSELKADTILGFLIKDGGENYRIHDPATWPEQAKLAYEGMFDQLKTLQEHLKGGKIVI